MSLLGIVFPNGVFNDAVKSNFGRQTFRYPEKATMDWLISLKIFKTIFLAQFKKQTIKLNHVDSVIAIFDGDLNKSELRFDYVKYLSGDSAKLQIGRQELINSVSAISSFVIIVRLLILSPAAFFLSIFSSNKLKYPLHLLNTFEAFNLLYLLNKYKINKLYFFCIYENDSNLLAYVLMKNKIFINKVTSESPLGVWNKCIIANKASFCFRYQEDECKVFKETMHFDSFQHWIPETSLGLIPFYKGGNYVIKKGTIGFYSSAMWLRQKLGRINLKDNAYLNEQSLFKFLVGFVKANTKYKLIVFLHPLEKKELLKTKDYYNALSENIDLADINIANAEQFFNAEVGVSLFSTLSFERIFWGFKTLIYPLGHSDFPIKKSTFNNICAKSERELETKLLIAMETAADEFFVDNGLSNYRYSEYQAFKNQV